MKLLLVEDSARLRALIKESLEENRPYDLESFATTENEAFELLDKHQFDLMVVDIELRAGNGFNVIQYTLNQGYAFKPPLPVIFTNHAYTSYREKAKQLGVKHFFDKSMEYDLAIQTILCEADKLAKAATSGSSQSGPAP